MSDITSQLKALSKEEEELIQMQSGLSRDPKEGQEDILPYDAALALGIPKSASNGGHGTGVTNLDWKDKMAAGLPCGTENFLLMFARWKKLERDLYNERKG